jgi:hypothetical protein
MRIPTQVMLIAVVFLASIASLAQVPSPPPQAFDACKDKKLEDTCSVSLMGRETEGQCVKFSNKGLVCLPKGMPRPQ